MNSRLELSRRARTAFGALGILSLILLVQTGCAVSSAGTPVRSQSPASATPAPSESPSSASPSYVLDDPSTWVISQAGVGPIRLGEPLSSAQSSLSAFTLEPTSTCQNASVRAFDLSGFPSVVLVLDDAGTSVAGIRVEENDQSATVSKAHGPVTAEGISVGSTFAAATAAYPGMTLDTSTGFADYAHVYPNGVWLSFASNDGASDAGSPIPMVDLYPGKRLFYELCGS